MNIQREQLKIEVTSDEKTAIKAAAKSKGMSVKDYILNLHYANTEQSILSNTELKITLSKAFVCFRNMNEDLRINHPEINREQLEKGLNTYALLKNND